MQTVSERLSQHVLNNYSRFVAGVTEVASVEHDLQVGNAYAPTLWAYCPLSTSQSVISTIFGSVQTYKGLWRQSAAGMEEATCVAHAVLVKHRLRVQPSV